MGTISEAFAAAQRHHRAGRLAQAKQGYRKILAVDPSHAGSLQFLGVIAHQSGQSQVAARLIGRALAVDPGSAEAHLNLANVFKDQGKLRSAIAHYQAALALRPESAEAHYSIAVAFQLQGELDQAAEHYGRVIALRPDIAEAQLNLGTIRADQGQLELAITCYRRALTLRPDYLAAHMNLGLALNRQGDPAAAAGCFERAVAIAPDNAQAQANLGMALAQLGRTEAALTCCEQAVALARDDPEAHLNLGIVLAELGRFGTAVTHFARALALRPDSATAHLNLAAALRELGRFDEAAAHYQEALNHDPALAEADHNWGLLLQQQGRLDEAVMRQERALSARPDFAAARLALCVAQLPILYADEFEIARCRAGYQDRLRKLCDDVGQGKAVGDLAAAAGSSQPFFLAYQQQNDRDLQALYGKMVCRAMAAKYPTPALASRRFGERIRIGVASGFFRWHTVWRLIIKGWISRLDRQKFEVFGYHTGTARDATTTVAAGLCDQFVPGPLPAEHWREIILADRPDVLIYPEVGMDAIAGWLAAHRLARAQCVAWGHPETSGFPTMDYFLTSAAMEPADGQDHYTEQLIRLPNLSIYYEPPEVEPMAVERSELGLRSTAVAFWCAQSLYKYLPQYDEVFPRIARDVGDCQFVFIRFPYGDYATELFRKRLERAFARFGLRAADHCVILPVLEPPRFLAAASKCDIGLDSIGWSGGLTTLESLGEDLPIVTLPGCLMRGRHTMAMLKIMGVTDTIATTVDDYVSLAVRLSQDLTWRANLRNRIAEKKHHLYRDDGCISALEEFIEDTAEAHRIC